MRALTFDAPASIDSNTLKMTERPIPMPGFGEIRVKITADTIDDEHAAPLLYAGMIGYRAINELIYNLV